MNEVIKKLNGNVLGIGLNKELVDLIEKNKNITECNLLDSYSKGKKKFNFFHKTIKINKIRKKFKKKKIDYIVCDYEVIKDFFSTFVSDSIYINKSKIYYYNVDNMNLINRYKRYNSIINKKNDYVEINNENSYTNYFKDRYYRIKDFINNMIELIGDILMS